MHPNFVGVTGLPRAGSTLLGIRRSISDDSFFAQLDNAFENSYAHLASAMRGFLHGWHHDCRKKAVVDRTALRCMRSKSEPSSCGRRTAN
jgi:sulfotransferase